MKKLILTLLLATQVTTFLKAQRTSTYVINQEYQTNIVFIEDFETAKVSLWDNIPSSYVKIVKQGAYFQLNPKGSDATPNTVVIRGPAILLHIDEFGPPAQHTRVSTNGTFASLMTVEITPEAFPPDKTVTLGPHTSARVAMETSTNLVHWALGTNGTYTAEESPKFFRLRTQVVE